MVVEAVGGRSRSEEKSKSGTFPPRLGAAKLAANPAVKYLPVELAQSPL